MKDWEGVTADETWNAGAMGCGELVAELRRRVKQLQPRQTLHLIAQDTGALEDIPAWCRITGNALILADHPNYLIERKGE